MIRKLLYEINDDERILTEDLKLSEVLDSYALIELFSKLQDRGIVVHPTRIKLSTLKTISDLEDAIEREIHEKQC